VSVTFHPEVASDLAEAAHRYDSVSHRLADQFLEEFRRLVRVAAENPHRFHPVGRGFRRANLRRFPYHFLYRVLPDGIRVTLVKHHRRDPDYGLARE
jgi:plasmid stabilization system protein ParE